MKASKLWATIFMLGYEPALNGEMSAEAKQTLSEQLTILLLLLKEYNIVTLGLPLHGRPMPDLFTSLNKGDYEPSVPVPPSTHFRYIQIKELLTSLEEDRVKVQNGIITAKATYRAIAKALKEEIIEMQAAMA